VQDSTGRPDAVSDGAGEVLLARPRLLTVIEGRWSRPVTAVVAGAGFGKTTLLDQARAAAGPVDGIDITLRIEPGDANGERLAARLLGALGVDASYFAGADELLDLLVDELWASAPKHLCLILDDLHEIAKDSGGTQLLRALVHRLPGNAHLLVASRRLPEICIARLAVSRRAEVLREADLRFTPDELDEFARRRNIDAELLLGAQGWPALAELLAHSRGVDLTDYVREEVIGPIGAAERSCIVELAAVGRADDEMASALAGRDVQLATVLADVPLARREADGAWELHEVIATELLEQESPEHIAEIRRRGGEHARTRGDLDVAMRLFTAAGARDDVVAVLRDQFVRPANQ